MTQYYSIEDDGARLATAPSMLWPNLRRPTEDEYRSAGYHTLADDDPNPPEGETVVATSYALGGDGIIHPVYVYGPVPKVPRVFSKLYLRLALEKRGLDGALDAWVESAGLTKKWNDCNELSESFDGFDGIVTSVCEALGIDDATRDEVLEEAVAR